MSVYRTIGPTLVFKTIPSFAAVNSLIFFKLEKQIWDTQIRLGSRNFFFDPKIVIFKAITVHDFHDAYIGVSKRRTQNNVWSKTRKTIFTVFLQNGNLYSNINSVVCHDL